MRSDGEETHAAILQAAQSLFLTHGYHGTSMRMIADAANITPAAIYNHFAGKEALFTTLLEHIAPLEPLTALLEHISGDNVEALLSQLVAGMFALASEHQAYVRLGLIDVQERQGAAVAGLLPRLLPRFLNFYGRLTNADTGARLRDVPPHLLIRGLVSLMAGYILTDQVIASVEPGFLPPVDWEHGFTRLFLYGALRPPT